MEIQEFVYAVQERKGHFSVSSPEDPRTSQFSSDDFEMFQSLVFPAEEELLLEGQDFVQITFGIGPEAICTYKLTAGEEVFQWLSDRFEHDNYTGLAEFIAIHWGITSQTQLRNFLIIKDQRLTEKGGEYWDRVCELKEEEKRLVDETLGAIEGSEKQKLFSDGLQLNLSLQRKVCNLNGVRRMLWNKVCQLQEKLEKFAAATKSIAGSPVKPEYIDAVNQSREEIHAVKSRITELEEKTEVLIPYLQRYQRSLAWICLGILLIIGFTALHWFSRVEVKTAVYGGIVGSLFTGYAFIRFLKLKPSIDEYYQYHDELLDRRIQYRQAKKKHKKLLAGEKEEDLWKRVRAQREAEMIRTHLEFALDKFTKAWQRRSKSKAKEQLQEARKSFDSLLEQFCPQLRADWTEYFQRRQGLIDELEPVSAHTLLWEETENSSAQQEWDRDRYKYYQNLIVSEFAPVFVQNGSDSDLNRQRILVR